jgi:hypothetical protein
MRAVPRLCEFYPGICLTTEEKAWKNQEKPQSEYSVPITKTPTHYKTHTHAHNITKQYKTTTVQIKTKTVQDIPK